MKRNGALHRPRIARPPVANREPEGAWEQGKVKWFDPDRYFGFVVCQDGQDAILHKNVVRAAGVNPADLFGDRPIRFKARPVPGRSPEVTWLRLMPIALEGGRH